MGVAAAKRPPRRSAAAPPPDAVDRVALPGFADRLTYRIVRSARRRRTTSLQVTAQGEVVVRAPLRAPLGDIRAFVERSAEWIAKRLADRHASGKRPVLGHGGAVPVLGHETPLVVAPGAHPGVVAQWTDGGVGALHVTYPAALPEEEARAYARRALERWYRTAALEVFTAAVDAWRGRVAPEADPAVRIGGARTRWGSCSPKGVLRFSWRSLMLPPRLVDYLAVHELAHLRQLNHSPAFWRIVQEALGDAAERRRELRALERTLPE